MKEKRPRVRPGRWLASVCLAGILVVVMMAPNAPASFPGRDGLLVTFAFDFDAGADLLVTVDPKSGATEEIVADTDDYLGSPHWSPDGERIAFTRSSKAGSRQSTVWTVNADGSGETMVGRGVALDYSPDGLKILISDRGDLATVSVDGTRRRTILKREDLLRRGRGSLSNAAWSPTGKLIAYDANKTGNGTSKRSLYVVRPNGSGKKPLPSLSGGTEPEWSPNGRTLFYTRNTKVPVKILSLKLGAERPRKLTKGYASAVSPSGKTLAFARVDDLYTVSLAGGEPERLDLLPEADVDPFDGALDWQPLP